MVNIIGETGIAIISPLQTIWLKIVEGLPALLGAIIVLIIGCFVAVILGHAVRVILEKAGLETWIKKAHLTKAVGHTNVSALAGEILKWYIIIIFLQTAVALVNLGTLSALLNSFVMWLPNLIVAVIVVLFGLAVAHYVQIKITEHSKQKGAKVSAALLKWIIIIIVAVIALKQIGIQVAILENVIYLIVGALAVGIALALGIGLGLGLRKEAETVVKGIKKSI